MFTRQDEVLFRGPGGAYVLVHLTWASKRDDFVSPRVLSDWAAAAAEIEHMSQTW